jgi:predicted PurR-regulated permease PerM
MKNSTANNSKQLFETILQLGLVFLILGYCFNLLAPFVTPILWAIIFAIILYPLFNWLQKKLKGKTSLSATIIVLCILGIVILPSVAFFGGVTSGLMEVKSSIDAGTLKIEAPGQAIKEWPVIGEKAYDFLYSASTNLEKTLLEHKEQIKEISTKVLGSLVSSIVTILQIVLSVIIAGVFMASTSAQNLATNFIMRISGDKGDEYIEIFVSTVRQVVKGIIGVAVIQTLIQAVGLFMCGVPFPGILTLLCLILSIIQIGPIIVNIGVIAYLFSTGDSSTAAVFWTVFFILSGLSDNVLKPLLLGKGALVPMLVIFIGVIGGFMMSGFIGLFVGPIVFSIGYKLFIAWMDDKPEADQLSVNDKVDIELQ